MRKFWVGLSDWSRWTPEYREKVEAWCASQRMEVAIDLASSDTNDLQREAWRGKYVGGKS